MIVLYVCLDGVAQAGPRVVLNGKAISYDVLPVLENGRVLVPLRATFEALGATVEWDAKSETIVAVKGNKTIQLAVGSKIAYIDGIAKILDVPAKIIDSRTLVPLRFVSEAFSASVDWNPNDQTVSILLSQSDITAGRPDYIQLANNQKSVVLIEVLDENIDPVGQGSGFIADPSGLIVTNYHVIEGSTSVRITMNDKTVLHTSEVAEYDIDLDIAVLKVPNINLPALKLGDSDKIAIGEEILVIGSPMGLHNSVSNGIISGVRNFEDFDAIQITAPISAGSSGGVLINSSGEVIGVTAFGLKDYENFNFAIPINYVKPLLKKDSPGIQISELTPPDTEDTHSYSEFQDSLRKQVIQKFGGKYVLIENFLVFERDNTIYVSAFINNENYQRLFESELENTQKDIKSWMLGISDSAKKLYPDKELVIGLYVHEEFSSPPDNFRPEEIIYSEGSSFVLRIIAAMYLSDGRYKYEFKIHGLPLNKR